MDRPITIIALLTLVAAMLGGCNDATKTEGAMWPTQAICTLAGTEGNESVQGHVTFTQDGDAVLVEAFLTGLTPGDHGFHVHEYGDVNCTDGTCTGGHFNPTGTDHGGPDARIRHVGDLGNLPANSSGIARYRHRDRLISLDMASANCIIGRAIIVHAQPDDLVSQPTGAAGARVAAGVIGIGKSGG
jgi:Cu-Zn family superoxide dismutase